MSHLASQAGAASHSAELTHAWRSTSVATTRYRSERRIPRFSAIVASVSTESVASVVRARMAAASSLMRVK